MDKKLLLFIILVIAAVSLLVLSNAQDHKQIVVKQILIPEYIKVNIRGDYTKTGNPRVTFISREAKDNVLEWLKVRGRRSNPRRIYQFFENFKWYRFLLKASYGPSFQNSFIHGFFHLGPPVAIFSSRAHLNSPIWQCHRMGLISLGYS